MVSINREGPEGRAFAAVKQELEEAMGRFGSFASPHEGYAVILEELDELWEEIKRGEGGTNASHPSPSSLRSEAVQVAAMAMRFLIECCDH